MFTKGPFVIESFITIGSFNCDHTKLVFNGQYENKNIMLKKKLKCVPSIKEKPCK